MNNRELKEYTILRRCVERLKLEIEANITIGAPTSEHSLLMQLNEAFKKTSPIEKTEFAELKANEFRSQNIV